MDNDGYIELKDIRRDRIKHKSSRFFYDLWQATKDFFGWMGLEFKKLFKKGDKPLKAKKSGKISRGFVSMLQTMARNADSWDKAEKKQPNPFVPISLGERMKSIPKIKSKEKKPKVKSKKRKRIKHKSKFNKVEVIAKQDNFFTPSESSIPTKDYWDNQ